MAKFTKEKEMYGELLYLDEVPTLIEQIKKNYLREYSKLVKIYKLEIENLGQEFNQFCRWTKKDNLRRYRLIGQISQTLMVVQRVDTGRWYRMPSRDVAIGFNELNDI